MLRFIKYNADSEMAAFLRTKPLANHLASIIASRARRTDCKFTKLKKSQCFLGNYSKIGLTEQQYRTAKKQLTKINFATFKGTNKGTVATLVSTDVWDINVKESNEQPNTQVTSEATDKQRLTKNVKKEKKDNKLLIGAKIPDSFSSEIESLFFEYLKMRISKRKKIATERGINLKLNRLDKYLKEHGEEKVMALMNKTLDKEWLDIDISYLDNSTPKHTPSNPQTPKSLIGYLESIGEHKQIKYFQKTGQLEKYQELYNENKFKLTNIAKGYTNPTINTYFIFECMFMPLGKSLSGSKPDRKLESLYSLIKKQNDYNKKHGNIREILKKHAQTKVL